MSNGLKFGIVVIVVVGIVAAGYYLSTRKNAVDKTKRKTGTFKTKVSDFFTTVTGKTDYSRNADGTHKRV